MSRELLLVLPHLQHCRIHGKNHEESYLDPVFDNSDTNNDGVLDNPGSVLYYKPTRTGQKTNHSIGWGISMNITIPLDKRHNEGCLKAAANTQNQLNATAG